mmetsp:Transcript_21020/g.45699  ORF Transcript_21020/g.45699 Transcript_21020/m.45699 type:complete len:214 (-) Transcript_21020:364-1005(-)
MHCFGEHVTSHRERPSRPPFVVMQNHLCMVVSFRGAHFQKNYALRACDSSRRAVVVAGCASPAPSEISETCCPCTVASVVSLAAPRRGSEVVSSTVPAELEPSRVVSAAPVSPSPTADSADSLGPCPSSEFKLASTSASSPSPPSSVAASASAASASSCLVSESDEVSASARASEATSSPSPSAAAPPFAASDSSSLARFAVSSAPLGLSALG